MERERDRQACTSAQILHATTILMSPNIKYVYNVLSKDLDYKETGDTQPS